MIPRVENNKQIFGEKNRDDRSRSEGHLLIHLTICPDGEGHCERHQCHCGKQTLFKKHSPTYFTTGI